MTDRPIQRKDFDSEGISIEAASWVLQIENGALSKEDRATLREWLGRSPAHEQALREYASAWMSIDDLMLAVGDVERERRGFPWTSAARAIFRRRVWWPAMPVLASLIIFFYVAGGLFISPDVRQPAVEPIIYSTKLGEQAQFRLTDGSVIHLNTDSMVEVEYYAARRLVRLVKGEALFDVAPNKNRPFDVLAAERQVSAVGTAFSVRLTSRGLNVVVKEGVVGVARVLEPPSEQRRSGTVEVADRTEEFQAMLEPNEKMVVEAGTSVVEKLEEEVVDRQLSWREGILKFEDDPLPYVIEEVSRYTDTRIILTDSALQDLRVGGIFRTGEVTSLLTALEISFDLQSRQVDASTIELSRRGTISDEG